MYEKVLSSYLPELIAESVWDWILANKCYIEEWSGKATDPVILSM